MIMITDTDKKSFRQLLKETIKSKDTEEWLDIYFTRPVGLAVALMCRKLGIHPNTVTIISLFIGAAGGAMFYFRDLWCNVVGVLLLVSANILDSTDGQLARLTGQKTLLGRILDGFAENVWFVVIYLAIIFRLWNQPIPGLPVLWTYWAFILAAVAGCLSHSPQCLLSDYYRQIHLFFLNGKKGAELDSFQNQQALYDALPKSASIGERAFQMLYVNYCKQQEKKTPVFQDMIKAIYKRYGTIDALPQELRTEFLAGSRPLMPFTNILTYNVRAICLYITCLADCPWMYLLFEITVMNLLYIYMHQRHEALCKKILTKIG